MSCICSSSGTCEAATRTPLSGVGSFSCLLLAHAGRYYARFKGTNAWQKSLHQEESKPFILLSAKAHLSWVVRPKTTMTEELTLWHQTEGQALQQEALEAELLRILFADPLQDYWSLSQALCMQLLTHSSSGPQQLPS